VLGATIFLSLEAKLFLTEGPYIIYQVEQFPTFSSSNKLNDGYLDVLERAKYILEYSQDDLRLLLDSPRTAIKTSFLPPSFHRYMEKFRQKPDRERDIDVLFFGSSLDRRIFVLEGLRTGGLNVLHLFGSYGQELIDHIRLAKIIVNIHYSENSNTLETMRLSVLLANRCFVISEMSDHNPYGDGVVFVDYSKLVETCHAYLHSPEKREAVAAEGYLAVGRSDMVSDLDRVLQQLPLIEFVHRA
jgi:hypothetical protein